MNIQILIKLTEIINLSALCEKSGLNTNTISAKIKNDRELKVDEAEKLRKVLAEYGFINLQVLKELPIEPSKNLLHKANIEVLTTAKKEQK